MCNNVYDDFTDFGIWIHQIHKNLNILRTKHRFFRQIKYNVAKKNNCLAALTFNFPIRKGPSYFPCVD